MQNMIVVLLIGLAMLYLIIKWLPAKNKQMLTSWLSKKAPGLMRIMPVSDCSGGCSACGTCSDGAAKKNVPIQSQKMKFFPNIQK